jgi:acyl carrier protein
VETTAMIDSNRLEGLEGRAIKVLEDTSGYDLSNADREISFSELGFDSLLLTQVSTALKREFGVDVTFRTLLENCTSIRELTEHLAKELPAETVAPARPAVQFAMPTSMPIPEGVAMDPQSMRSDIKSLIDQQITLMQMQLQVLGAARGAVPMQAGVAATPVTSVSATTSPAVKSPDRPREQTAEEAMPKKHTPGTRIEKSRTGGGQLTRAQQTYVDKLIRDYATCTAASKAYAQRHRAHLADPRTVSGFNPRWKEMVYPIVTNRSKGSKIWDIDGREYIDLTNGFGPISATRRILSTRPY